MCIYIYIERERDVYTYVYIYIYIATEGTTCITHDYFKSGE